MDFGSPGAPPFQARSSNSSKIWGCAALTSLLVYMRPEDRQENKRHEDREGKTTKYIRIYVIYL